MTLIDLAVVELDLLAALHIQVTNFRFLVVSCFDLLVSGCSIWLRDLSHFLGS